MSKEFDLPEFIPKMDFHPCNTPSGILNYNLNVLTDNQQEKLNELKVNVARENYKYFAAHPEIRAIVQLILRKVLTKQPKFGVIQYIAKIFTVPQMDLKLMIDDYLKETNLQTTDPENSGSNFSFEFDFVEEEQEKFDLPASVNLDEIDDNLITDYLKSLYLDDKLNED